jgi:hypothetical protein
MKGGKTREEKGKKKKKKKKKKENSCPFVFECGY